MRGWETALSIIIQKAGGNMNIQEIIDKKISKLSDEITMASDNIASNNIRKADYDKTLIGFVSEKIVPEKPKNSQDFKWRIQTNGTAYDIESSACNISSIGQRVRLYIPNHNYYNKYAEVITNDEVNTHPIKVVYREGQTVEDNSNGSTHTLSQDTITEMWENFDGTLRQAKYTILIKDKGTFDENVEKIIYPDESEMLLEGFNTFFGGGI